MVGFPLLMWYMWIGATYYDGKFPLPEDSQSWTEFGHHLVKLVKEGAFPHWRAWRIYWMYYIFEEACYVLLPGFECYGKPIARQGGRQLKYHCSAYASFYCTILVMAVLHGTGYFPIYTFIDEFGPLMSVAILSGFLASFFAYFSAFARGAQNQITGYPIYDFFMGVELNPRIFGILDFNMHTEKLGFMLIFWNMAGVPMSYCHCALYLANRDPATYAWDKSALAALYVSYLFVYYIWDTTNSQKTSFRMMEKGTFAKRRTFPQPPWQEVCNPRAINTARGEKILADGWYGYARKTHYTCDVFFALAWGLITGVDSPFAWFYSVFFIIMIAHRTVRDVTQCRQKYGAAWEEYERRVPYLFIPVGVSF